MRTENGIRRSMPAIHFERLLQSVNAKCTGDKGRPANEPRAQCALPNHLLANQPVNRAHTQYKQVGGQTTENTDHQTDE